jgi:hypothetical protein
MITILHGDNISKSREKYIERKIACDNPIVLEGSSLSLSILSQTFSSQALFSKDEDIFIENFFTKRKLIAKETKEIIASISKNESDHRIVFWESKKLTPAALKSFPKAKIEAFLISQNLFKYIDALAPTKGKELILLFHEAITQNEPELIFFMMVRQLRLLLALSLGAHIDEVKTIAPWQMGNLQRQLRGYTKEQLKNTYSQLFEIDLANKTGRSSLTLEQSIDIFLLNL